MINKKIHLNSFYSLAGDPVLEVLIPFNDDQELRTVAPAVLVVPGGAYMFCSLREGDPVALQYLAKGYNAFILYYSVNTAYPEPQLDLMAAFDYIKNHAAAFYTDPKEIHLIGFSAGGHLAGSYSYLYKDESLLKRFGKKPRFSLKPTTLTLGYPVVTMEKALTHPDTARIITGGDEELIEPLSIEEHITSDYPPTFLWTTKEDVSVSPENTIMLDKALTKAGVEHETVLYEHLYHGLSIATSFVNPVTPETAKDFADVATWVEKDLNFLAKY